MNAVGEDVTFVGVALHASDNSQSEKILVMTAGIIKATLVSNTYLYGNALKYDASANDGTLLLDSDGDTIAWIAGEEPGSSNVTEALVWFSTMPTLPGAADKLFEKVSA